MFDNKNRKIFSGFLFFLTIALFAIVFVRFSWIMVRGEIDGENLIERFDELSTSKNIVAAERGSIYDRHGSPIATDATSYKIVAILTDQWSSSEQEPYHVVEPDKVAAVLANHLPESESYFLELLNKDASQVEFGAVGNNLSYHTAHSLKEELEEKELTGINFEEKKSRFYPNGTFASHTIGLAQYPDYDEEDEHNNTYNRRLEGVMGLEASFDDVLAGINGRYTYKHDSAGYIIPNEPHYIKGPVNGDHIHTTIDRQLQILAEGVLDDIELENDPESSFVGIMEAKTGDMLVAAQRPSFNAETKENINESWQNIFIETGYEPGSTMKLLTTAAGVQEGVFRPDQYFQSGSKTIEGGTISDYNRQGWGWISHLEGLSKSSNVLFVENVQAMGLDTWKEHLDAYGFGELTGIKLPSEYEGSNPYSNSFQAATTSFGQGISVTGIQMMQAFSALANEGEMMQPRFVSKIEDEVTGKIKEIEPISKPTKISAEAANQTLSYAQQATEMPGSLTEMFRREGEAILAKTGTSEYVNPETGKYYKDRFIHSVVAMYPADNPEYILYITVQAPKKEHGGMVVKKIYDPLMDSLIDHYHADDIMSASEQFTETPTYLDQEVNSVLAELNSVGREHAIIGSGDTVIQQYPLPGTPLFPDQAVFLMTDGALTMPDVMGWSRNDVLKITELTGVHFEFEGEGFVVHQEKEPGQMIKSGETVKIRLAPSAPLAAEEPEG